MLQINHHSFLDLLFSDEASSGEVVDSLTQRVVDQCFINVSFVCSESKQTLDGDVAHFYKFTLSRIPVVPCEFVFVFQVQMSLPDNLMLPFLSDHQFYHENTPSINAVHRHTSHVAVAQHTSSISSPLPSPLHQLHHSQPVGQQSHTYTLRDDCHASFELHKFGLKHNQGGGVRVPNHSEGSFVPQRRFAPQGHNTAPGFKNQQQYNHNTWRCRKRDNPPALNQSR